MKGFKPQKAFMGLISTGDENAVLSWRGLASESAKLWTFKDHIDRKWMKAYKVSNNLVLCFIASCHLVLLYLPQDSRRFHPPFLTRPFFRLAYTSKPVDEYGHVADIISEKVISRTRSHIHCCFRLAGIRTSLYKRRFATTFMVVRWN